MIVFIKDAPRAGTMPASRIEMIQQDEAFVPRVLAITRGSTVDFPNADPFFHNVLSLSRAASFDLGRYPRSDRRSRTFTQPGLVKVYCHLHSHMTASIMVFDHQHFTSPAPDGRFVLTDVPAGDYRLSVARADRRELEAGDDRGRPHGPRRVRAPGGGRSLRQSPPPRLVVRTTIATLAMVAAVLTAVFVTVTFNVRQRVRSVVSEKLEAGQRMLSALEQRRARELNIQVATSPKTRH